MSCLGNSYLPQPPREWNRYENSCAYLNLTENLLTNLDEEIYVPFLRKTIIKKDFLYQLAVYRKGNILQYKKNSSNLTKQQRYSQIARGSWTNRNTTWASQSDTYSNPNTQSLKRVGYGSITIQGTDTTEAITCPSSPIIPSFDTLPSTDEIPGPQPPIIPPPPPTPAGNIPILPPIIPVEPIPSIVIPEGGNLICSIVENICTGEILKTTRTSQCNSSTSSDVPGKPILLCFNDGLPTYYTKDRNTYSAGGTKWPTNAKLWGTTTYIPT